MISYLRSSTHRPPYRPKLPSRYRLPHPPLLLLRPYLWPHSLTCASLPPLYPPPHTTSPTAMHMRYAHHLFHSASIAPLAAAPIAPAISWLSEHPLPARRAGKTLLLDAFKLSSRAVPYLLSFGWGQRYKIKNTSHKKWYKNGWARLRGMWSICCFARGSHALFPGCLSLAYEGEACLAPHSLGQDLAG
jgi:hypothetical protein